MPESSSNSNSNSNQARCREKLNLNKDELKHCEERERNDKAKRVEEAKFKPECCSLSF